MRNIIFVGHSTSGACKMRGVQTVQALEKYSIGATQKEIDGIQYLAEILITRIQSPNSISIFRKILTTAKAILWEIDKYKKQSQNTVESLLYFLKTSPKWAGDDFEECLERAIKIRFRSDVFTTEWAHVTR
jgi:hypothetical protein